MTGPDNGPPGVDLAVVVLLLCLMCALGLLVGWHAARYGTAAP